MLITQVFSFFFFFFFLTALYFDCDDGYTNLLGWRYHTETHKNEFKLKRVKSESGL